MIAENLLIETDKSYFCENFDLSDDFLIDSWSKVSIAIKQFTNNISIFLNEYIDKFGNEKVFKSSENGINLDTVNESIMNKLNNKIHFFFGSIEIKEAMAYINKKGFKIHIINCFLNNSLENSIFYEITSFSRNFEIICEDKFSDSRLMSNETSPEYGIFKQNDRENTLVLGLSNKNMILFHYCFFFGLVRVLWSYIFITYGMSYILGIEEKERYHFIMDYITNKDEYISDKLQDVSIRKIIINFRNKIHWYFSEGLPQNFDIEIEKYINNIIVSISDKISYKGDINLNNDIIQISLRERILKELFNGCVDLNKRMENCLSKIEIFQHYYEHISSKILSLNGSFPSNLDYDTLDNLFKLIENGVKTSIINEKDLDINLENTKMIELLNNILSVSVFKCLNLNKVNKNFDELINLHIDAYVNLVEFLLGSNDKKDISKYSNEVSIFNFVGDLILLLKLMGYDDIWRLRVVSALKLQAKNVISFLETRKSDESNLRIYSKYIHEFVGPLLMILLDGGVDFISGIDNYTIQRIYEDLYMEFNWSLKRRIINLINDFPENKNDILDLFVVMNSLPSSNILKDVWYSEISKEVSNYVNDFLLLPQIETSKIMGFYVKSIYFLLLLDIPNDWINKTIEGLGDVLRQRNDTTQCIVIWMPFLLENSYILNSESESIMPISCSDEGVYPQFSICYPNYKNECNVFNITDEEDECLLMNVNPINSMKNPQIKLVLSWISRIYGNNLTLLHDYIFNLASKVLGNYHDIGCEGGIIERGSRNGLIDDYSWYIDEKNFRRDESVYEMIKMTIGGHNGDDLLKIRIGNTKLRNKDEQQLITHCNIILQDISNSILDNREYNNYRGTSNNDGKTIVTGFTISRNYWSENIINIEIKEDSFPIAPILKEEIDEYKHFFEQEHPGRTFNCYLGYGSAQVDLTAMDNSIKSNVVLNFLQISIYDYISSRNEGRYKQEKKIKETYLDTDKLITSNTILNWFTISPKSSDRLSNTIEKEDNIELKVTFSDLLNYFNLDQQIIRWNIDNMISRGIIEIEFFNNQEFFNIPKTFYLKQDSIDQSSGILTSKSESNIYFNDSSNNLGVNDMTVMLDFNHLMKNNRNTRLIKNSNGQNFGRESDNFKKDILDIDNEVQNIQDQIFDENDDEDLNLNFPTGLITSSIPFRSRDNIDLDLTAAKNDQLRGFKEASNENRSGINNGNLPPMINATDTYLNKYCYFTTPQIFEDDLDTKFSESTSSNGEKMTLEKNELVKYDIIKECELLIRATLQLNGAMAPAVLFGRVRAAIANQTEGRSHQGDHNDNLDTTSSNNNQYVLTWPQHVQAINNMVDRGEIYNKGGRLFLEN